MRTGGLRRASFGAVLALLALAHGGRADDDAGDEPGFVAALESARNLCVAGKAAQGRSLLDATLEKHAGRDYARARRADLEDLVKRLAFRQAYAPPDPKTLVKGRLEEYVSSSGKIRIVYESSKPHDLESHGSLLVHPAHFQGTYGIEVRGASYPSDAENSPQIVVGLDENPKTHERQGWYVVFGTPEYVKGNRKVWLPARIFRRDGKEEVKVVEKDPSPATAGAPYVLRVRVDRTRVTATVNGKSIGQASKSTEVFGFVGFDAPTWTTVTIDGFAEPAWIQDKVDAVVQKNLAAFERTFVASKQLPAWLYEPSAAAARTPKPSRDAGDFPVPVSAEHRVLAVAALEQMAAEDYAGMLETIDELRKAGAPEALCVYLSAEAKYGLGDLKGALADADRTLELAPNHLDSMLARAAVLLGLGRADEATAAFRAAADAHPTSTLALELAGLFLLRSGRPDAARDVVQEAARRGVSSERLDLLGRALVKAQRGPEWAKTFEYRSANYHVVSDIDVETCRKASQILEEGLSAYRVHVGWVERDKTRLFDVYLFGGRAGFMKYMEDLSLLMGRPPEHVAGLYSPHLKQLLIWNLPSREEMMHTVRHEGFHQYLDRLLPDVPTWFNEGLAVYYESMDRVDGVLTQGIVQKENVEELRKGELVPLKTFLFQSAKEFYAAAPHSYAQAWLLIHLMRHGPMRHRTLFKTLMDRFATDPPYDALHAVFDAKTIADTEKDLAAYLKTL